MNGKKKWNPYLCCTVDLYEALPQLHSHHLPLLIWMVFKKWGDHVEATHGDERGRIRKVRFLYD